MGGGAYLQLGPELLDVGGVPRQLLPLGGVGQHVEGGLGLLQPLEEELQLPEGALQGPQVAVQPRLPVARPGDARTRIQRSTLVATALLELRRVCACVCECVVMRLIESRPFLSSVMCVCVSVCLCNSGQELIEGKNAWLNGHPPCDSIISHQHRPYQYTDLRLSMDTTHL